MPRKDLVSLSTEATDVTARIRYLQKLLEVCLDQIDPNKSDVDESDVTHKIYLLLDHYRASMDNHIQELEVALRQLKLLLVGSESDCN